MTQIDLEREKPIFNQRLKDEWEDAMIKRYIHKESGDPGSFLTQEEMQEAYQAFFKQNMPEYSLRLDSMRKQFALNQ